ncbi:MAG: hypothetical protein ING82_05230 [Roseomonas sp.]|nr:hypothetical protein [Roseomonas sp.]
MSIIVVTTSPSSDPTNLELIKNGLATFIANPALGRNVFGFDEKLATRDADGGLTTTVSVGGSLASACYSYRISETQAYLGGLTGIGNGQGFAKLAVHCNLAERLRVDGRQLECHAVVRVLPDGRLNETSAHILTHHFEFQPQGILAVDLNDFGSRGTHLRASAEPDGNTIFVRAFVRKGR